MTTWQRVGGRLTNMAQPVVIKKKSLSKWATEGLDINDTTFSKEIRSYLSFKLNTNGSKMIDSFGISIFGDGYYTRIPNFGILNFRILK